MQYDNCRGEANVGILGVLPLGRKTLKGFSHGDFYEASKPNSVNKTHVKFNFEIFI